MRKHALLTQEELDFIQDMQRTPHSARGDATSSLRVNGDRRLQRMLTHLVASDQVTLQAQFNNQQISIPLHLIEDEFHDLQLQLGLPEIYEDGPMLRAWRLTLDEPVALLDAEGHATELSVKDISSKGVLLQVDDATPAPTHFDLYFAPDDVVPISLHGLLRRRIGADLAAYDLSHGPAEEIDRLREYILQAHVQAHPELHARASD